LKTDRDKYVEMRNRYNSTFRFKKSNYYKHFVSENSSSTKSFWQKLNPFLNPNKKQKINVSLISNKDNNIHSSQDLVQAFSNFFSSILNKFKFIDIEICKSFVHNFFINSSSLSALLSTDIPKFEFGSIPDQTVTDFLKKINPKSAPGCVNIDAKLFKFCAVELSPALTSLFNRCVQTNSIPDEWKTAHVTPIYKGKGNKSSLDNYRPISILSPVAKAFEGILGQKLRRYFESNNLLHEDQHGFREGRSCHLALNTFVDYAKRKLDSKKHVIAIFLDFSKAFDTIDHQLLMIKLEKYGFSPNALELMKNYLSNRFSLVSFNGKFSTKELLKSGVPQGSILGPLLFIIFINDLCHLDLIAMKTIFADDTTLLSAGNNLHKIAEDLENDLKKVSEWLMHNRLLLNIKKNQVL
jgi:hypothetical protein